VSGVFYDGRGARSQLEMVRQGRESRLSLDKVNVKSRSVVLRHTPLLIFSQETLTRQISSSIGRRGVIDWCLFHVEPRYHLVLRKYRTALAQYNASLRQAGGDRGHWMGLLAQTGNELHSYRETITRTVDRTVHEISEAFHDMPDVRFEFKAGWAKSDDLLSVLKTKERDHSRLGYCSTGPHRSDLRIRSDRGEIQDWASRGQIKAYYYFLFLALMVIVADQTENIPIALIDDIWAEFDDSVAARMVGVTTGLKGQAIFTGTRRMDEVVSQYNMAVFHVKQGSVAKVNIGLDD